MYAIVNHIDGEGVSGVQTRTNQADANALAVDMAVEQGWDDNFYAGRMTEAEFKAGVLSALEVHGTYSGNGWDVTVVKTEPGYTVLDKPLSIAAMQGMVKGKDNTYIEGVIVVDPSDMIGNDLEGFLDLISEKLCDSPLLMDSNYTVVGHGEGDAIHLKVTGDVSAVLREAPENE